MAGRPERPTGREDGRPSGLGPQQVYEMASKQYYDDGTKGEIADLFSRCACRLPNNSADAYYKARRFTSFPSLKE